MNMNPITCPFCEKEYSHRKKTEYERHTILCELISSSNKRVDVVEEITIDDVPSSLQLYKLIRELGIQNKILQEKVAELNKIVQRCGAGSGSGSYSGGGISFKKADILERLNTQKIQPQYTFLEWIKLFDCNITEEDIEYLVSEPTTQVICNIMSRIIDESSSSLPVLSSDINVKKNIIYVYGFHDLITSPGSSPPQGYLTTTEYASSSPLWVKMEPEIFMILIKTIYTSLLKTLQMKWREKHRKRYNFEEIYNKVLKKITDIRIDTHTDMNNRKVLQHLCMRVSREV